MRILATVGLAVVIMGCGAARQMNERSISQQVTTILIVNEGMSVVRVYDESGRMATVMSRRAKCVKIRNPYINSQLSFSLLAARGIRYYALPQNFDIIDGWIWIINGNMPIHSTTTIFSHDICNPGAEGSLRDIRR